MIVFQISSSTKGTDYQQPVVWSVRAGLIQATDKWQRLGGAEQDGIRRLWKQLLEAGFQFGSSRVIASYLILS